jgi:hypothetical protein
VAIVQKGTTMQNFFKHHFYAVAAKVAGVEVCLE